MKKIIIFLAVIGAVYYMKPDVFSFMDPKGAFDEQGKPITLVFVHDKCGTPCSEAIDLLRERRVDFSLYELDGNEDNQALWKAYGGVNSFPNIITGNHRVYGSYRSRIVSAMALNYGSSVLNRSEKKLMAKHFHDNGDARLVMYGASWCGYCKNMRKELSDNDIDFVDIDVERSANPQWLMKTLDISGYPLMYYGYKRLEGPAPHEVLALF